MTKVRETRVKAESLQNKISKDHGGYRDGSSSLAARIPRQISENRRNRHENDPHKHIAVVDNKARKRDGSDPVTEQYAAEEQQNVDCRAQRGAAENGRRHRDERPDRQTSEQIADIDRLKQSGQFIRRERIEPFGQPAEAGAEQERKGGKNQLFEA